MAFSAENTVAHLQEKVVKSGKWYTQLSSEFYKPQKSFVGHVNVQ